MSTGLLFLCGCCRSCCCCCCCCFNGDGHQHAQRTLSLETQVVGVVEDLAGFVAQAQYQLPQARVAGPGLINVRSRPKQIVDPFVARRWEHQHERIYLDTRLLAVVDGLQAALTARARACRSEPECDAAPCWMWLRSDDAWLVENHTIPATLRACLVP